MSFASPQSRYDEFQEEAVLACLEDFNCKPSGRYLLVIPTGGGKTFTAVKIVNRMFSEGLLNPDTDRVMWVAHRQELIEQASGTFERFEQIYAGAPSFKNNVDFSMISKATTHLGKREETRLVIIDEAHHSAARSYLPLFGTRQDKVGVLGLTATPTRYDNEVLPFDRESYSIGFPDLVNMGVVLRPEVHIIKGGEYVIDDLSDNNQLEALNDETRNNEILKAILANPEIYKKIVIYVGTKTHSEDLAEFLQDSSLAELYESIGFIHGGKNSRDEDRAEFLVQEKCWERSILVNVGILSEGYDDPTINTVIMAAPTRSKLTYMQAIGRAIRHDPDDELKNAFIIEIQDELPNIQYRIDNRWLYADISDALEPAVVDMDYASDDELRSMIDQIYDEYRVAKEHRIDAKIDRGQRYSLLLFRVYEKDDEFSHYPLLIDNNNRLHIGGFFNFYSEQMRDFVAKEYNLAQVLSRARYDDIPGLQSEEARQLVFDAMRNATRLDQFVAEKGPWITFVAFRVKRAGSFISQDLQEFLDSLVNRDAITNLILEAAYAKDSVLVRLPLPLGGYIGRILTSSEFENLDKVIDGLRKIAKEHVGLDHRRAVTEFVDSMIIPLEYGHARSLLTLVRESTDHFRRL